MQERLAALVEYIEDPYGEMKGVLDSRQAGVEDWQWFKKPPQVAELPTICRAAWEARTYIDVVDFKPVEKLSPSSRLRRAS